MPAARAEYVAPWWVLWLHRVPRLDLRLQPVDGAFRPRDESYQESLLFLALVVAVGLGLNLIFLATYLICQSCRRPSQTLTTKRHESCSVTWTAVVAGLGCCAAVGVGFYGNSETNDGVSQMTHSLESANQTFSGIDDLVFGTTRKLQVDLEQHLARLSELLASRRDYVQTLQYLQQMAGGIENQLSALPVWREVIDVLTEVTNQTDYIEYYRWLSYLLLFMLDLSICLLACLGLAKRSRCLLVLMLGSGVLALILCWTSLAADAAAAVATSDLCAAPDTFILNITEGHLSTAKDDLLDIQLLLNSTESSLHQLTALLDCRGLHKDYEDALVGLCYDGIEGLLFLGLFSLLAMLAFSTMICTGPRAWAIFSSRWPSSRDRDYDDIDEDDPFNPQAQRVAPHHAPRGPLHSFCSYSSGLGSQTSLHPPTQTISNAPVSEYMNQAALFGGTPRYENVPLIGRGSPPPTYSPSMRATYLSVADEQHMRHYGRDFPA